MDTAAAKKAGAVFLILWGLWALSPAGARADEDRMRALLGRDAAAAPAGEGRKILLLRPLQDARRAAPPIALIFEGAQLAATPAGADAEVCLLPPEQQEMVEREK